MNAIHSSSALVTRASVAASHGLIALVLAVVVAGSAASARAEPMGLERVLKWTADAGGVDDTAAGDAGKSTQQRMASSLARLSEQWPGAQAGGQWVVMERPTGERVSGEGIPVIRARQTVLGLPVFGAGVNLVLADTGAVRGVSGGLAAHDHQVALADFRLTPVQAIEAAVRDAGSGHLAITSSRLASASGARSHYRIAIGARQSTQLPLVVEPLWYPTAQRLLPAYRVHVQLPADHDHRPNARVLMVSAIDGSVLRDTDLIRDFRSGRHPSGPLDRPVGTVAYRVMAGRDGVPYVDPFGLTVPHPTGQANGWVPRRPAPGLLLWRRHAGNVNDDPWLPDSAQHTRGNNVDAFFKGVVVRSGRYLDNPFDVWTFDFHAANGDFRAPMTGPRRFDYYYDVALAPDDYFQRFGDVAVTIPSASAQLNAKIVQSFYTANWLHDLFHGLGFDEAAGNMQQDNFGRGGIDGDPLMVYAGFPVTFAYTPDDGISPALALGLNAFSLSNRDVSAFDFAVVAHEWAHTLFGRLTTMTHTGQPAALNEGTADFVGVFLMVRPEHRFAAPNTGDFHGAYPFGAYNNLDYDLPGDAHPPAGSPGYPDNTWYHGVRRFPYSASLAINPVTFGHISPDNPLPAGFAPFDWKGRGTVPFEIHTAGEIWASALWQCARNLLAETRTSSEFVTAQRQVLAYLVAGLKLFPVDATYTEARDAVLMAVRSASEDDYLRCRAGFAQRGLGAAAVSPPRDSVQFHGVVESFVDADPPALRTMD